MLYTTGVQGPLNKKFIFFFFFPLPAGTPALNGMCRGRALREETMK